MIDSSARKMKACCKKLSEIVGFKKNMVQEKCDKKGCNKI
jgi:hypothetical protein